MVCVEAFELGRGVTATPDIFCQTAKGVSEGPCELEVGH